MRIAICLLFAGCAAAPPPPPSTPNNGSFHEAPGAVAQWVDLGPVVPVDELTHRIDVSDPNAFGELLVKGTAGEAKISQVQIEYPDHTVYNVDLQRRLEPGEGQVIELRQRRPITKITIYTSGNSNGTFTIFGA